MIGQVLFVLFGILAAASCAAGAEGSTSDANQSAKGDVPHGGFNRAGLWEWTGPTSRSEKIKYLHPEVPAVELPAYKGTRYEAVVPDTLDLAERAALAVHGLTGCLDADADYEMYFAICFKNNPPYAVHDFNDHVQTKFHEGLPLLRLASGSRLNEQVDQRWMEMAVQMQGPDGVLYQPLVGRPWATKNVCGSLPEKGRQYTEPAYNGRMLAAVALYYQLTGDDRWKQRGVRIVDGLMRKAVYKADYAHFTKWIYGLNEVPGPNEPLTNDSWCRLGYSWVTMGLAQFYRVTQYRPALDLAGKLARCTQRDCAWFSPEGHWKHTHFHGQTYQLLALLEYAMIVGDQKLIDFVRTGYQDGAAKMCDLTGFAPEQTHLPQSPCETCCMADMLQLALKLTQAGAGDYWDDIDRWTRNHFAESQLTRVDWVYNMAKGLPLHKELGDNVITENVPERCVGAFAGWSGGSDWQDISSFVPTGSIQHCCTGNAARALYCVWRNILTYRDGGLRVNLLLNRASPWADIDSSIPYEGRVDVKIKKASELSVRIPEWVTPQQATCQVNGADRSLSWAGRYAVVGQVEPNDVATLTFPIPERTDKVRIQGKEYTLIRKGNDVVHIDPPGKYNPLYQRDKYREKKTRTKKVERFVAQQQIEW